MRSVIAFDTETHLGEGGPCPCGETHNTATPPWVCSSLSGGPETLEHAKALAIGVCGAEHVFFHVFDDGSWGMVLTGPNGARATTLVLSIADINVAHFAGYDVGVLANEVPGYLHQAATDLGYDGGKHRLRCTVVREQTIAAATDEFYGRVFSLAETVKRRFRKDISGDKKNPDAWRLRYAELDGMPVKHWPKEAIEYALMDAVWARLVYLSQARPMQVDGNVVVSEDGDVATELINSRMGIIVMPWMRNRGVRVDPEKVHSWVSEVEEEVAKGEVLARALGIIRVNRCSNCDGRGFHGSYPNLAVCQVCWGQDHEVCLAKGLYKRKARNGIGSIVKAALQDMVTWMYDGDPPHTPPTETFPQTYENPKGGQVSTNNDAISEAPKSTPTINAYIDTLFAKKQMTTYVPKTLAAAEADHHTVWSWPNPIVTSNRTSWRAPNLTNPPRKGEYRECHIPRPGMVMASLDFSSLELRTHAQYNIDTFGFSEMAKVLNNPDGDVYLDFAAKTMGIPYDEALRRKNDGDKEVKDNRQTHKIAVLGYPGGLGANSFIGYARGMDRELRISEALAARLKKDWQEAYPEMGRHLKRISELSDLAGGGRFTMVDRRTGWVKGGCNYTSAANFTFQAPGGAILKHAAWKCWLGCYIEQGSALYDKAHLLITIHDEIIFEGDEVTAHEWAHEAAERMVAAAEEATPDVKHYVEPALMRRWYKSAEPVYVDGRLVPWEPKEVSP